MKNEESYYVIALLDAKGGANISYLSFNNVFDFFDVATRFKSADEAREFRVLRGWSKDLYVIKHVVQSTMISNVPEPDPDQKTIDSLNELLGRTFDVRLLKEIIKIVKDNLGSR